MFVDLPNKELRISKNLRAKKHTASWDFKGFKGNKIFVCVNLYDQNDYAEIVSTSIISESTLQIQAPIDPKQVYFDSAVELK